MGSRTTTTDPTTDPTTDAPQVRTVVTYCRTSTNGTAGQRRLDQQAKELEAEAIVQGWRVAALFADLGTAGDTLDRPGLKATLQTLANHQADAVLTCDPGRLSSEAFVAELLFDLAAVQGWQILTPKPPPQNLEEGLGPLPEGRGALPADLRRALNALTPLHAPNRIAAESPRPISPIRRWRRG
jgi:Resolvase, N terminal domain